MQVCINCCNGSLAEKGAKAGAKPGSKSELGSRGVIGSSLAMLLLKPLLKL